MQALALLRTPRRSLILAHASLLAAAGVAWSGRARAINQTDLTQDKSGGKTFTNVADNIDVAAKTGASLMISLVALAGFVVVAISLYALWKASKDDSGREKPVSAIVGLFIGGAMAAVSTVMWIMKNTVVGS